MIRKIAILRFSSMGDVILATPLIQALHNRFPYASIDFIVKDTYADLVRFNPHLHSVVILDTAAGFSGLRDLKKRIQSMHYDLLIDVHDNLRSNYIKFRCGALQIITYSKQHLKRYLLVRWKINTYPGGERESVIVRYLNSIKAIAPHQHRSPLVIAIPESTASQIGNNYFKNPGSRKTVVLIPGATSPTKEWLVERYAQVANLLIDGHDFRAIIVGGLGNLVKNGMIADRIPRHCIDSTGKTSLLETAEIIKRADLVISVDTGAMHMARAFDIKMVALFGPTVEEFGFYPRYDGCIIIERSLPCRPCSLHGTKGCPRKHFRCMQDIDTDAVYHAALRLLSSGAVSR